jgi:mono/diheme cytochrome c family protein
VSERGSVKAWVLAFVLMAGLGLGAFIGIGCLVDANTCPGSSKPKQTSTDGETLYLANCAACHGIDASGSRGPSLVSGPGGELSLEELMARINNGKRLAGMPKFEGVLNEQQIRAVAEYVVELRTGAQS